MVMEFVEGVPVSPPDSPRKLLDIAVQMAEGKVPPSTRPESWSFDALSQHIVSGRATPWVLPKVSPSRGCISSLPGLGGKCLLANSVTRRYRHNIPRERLARTCCADRTPRTPDRVPRHNKCAPSTWKRCAIRCRETPANNPGFCEALKTGLQSELRLPRIQRAGNLAKRGSVRVQVWELEVRVVEQIEELGTELKA